MAPSSEDLRQEAGVARAVGVYRRTHRVDKRFPDISGGIRICAETVTRNVPSGTCIDVVVFGILLPTIPDSSMVEHPAVNRVVPGSSPGRGANSPAIRTPGGADDRFSAGGLSVRLIAL